MTRYIALLRAVNVGGHKAVSMNSLRELLEGLGFIEPRSLLQSGNLVFGAPGTAPEALERTLEAQTHQRLGLQTQFFVRTAEQWNKAIAENPFPQQAKADPSHLVMLVMKHAPTTQNADELRASIGGRELVCVSGRQAYITYPDGIGRSRLTNAILEKRLATSATGRNWNTVLKLGVMVNS